MRISVLAVLAAFILPLPIMADTTTYTYTGSDFTAVSGPYTTSDSVTGEFTLSAPLADNLNTLTAITPTSYSFSDGIQTLTTGIVADFYIETDAIGDITGWSIQIDGDSDNQIETVHTSAVPGYEDGISSSSAYGDDEGHGTWTSATAVTPEPASLFLVATGLAGAASLSRRRFNHA